MLSRGAMERDTSVAIRKHRTSTARQSCVRRWFRSRSKSRCARKESAATASVHEASTPAPPAPCSLATQSRSQGRTRASGDPPERADRCGCDRFADHDSSRERIQQSQDRSGQCHQSCRFHFQHDHRRGRQFRLPIDRERDFSRGMSGDDPMRKRTEHRSAASGAICRSRVLARRRERFGNEFVQQTFRNRQRDSALRATEIRKPAIELPPQQPFEPLIHTILRTSPPARRSTSVRLERVARALDGRPDRGPTAVFTPEVENRKRFGAANNPRVGTAAFWTDFALGSRNLRRAAAFLATLCRNGFWMHRCTAHHI